MTLPERVIIKFEGISDSSPSEISLVDYTSQKAKKDEVSKLCTALHNILGWVNASKTLPLQCLGNRPTTDPATKQTSIMFPVEQRAS